MSWTTERTRGQSSQANPKTQLQSSISRRQRVTEKKRREERKRVPQRSQTRNAEDERISKKNRCRNNESTHVRDDTRKRLTSRRGHKEGVEDRRRQARVERLQKRGWFSDAAQRIGLTFGPFESSSSAIFVTQLRCLCGLRIAQHEP